MSSLILSLISRTGRALNCLSLKLQQQQVDWFTNQSGHSSFRADVKQIDGGFTAIILHRTGYSSRDWRYKQYASTAQFTSARKALRNGRRMAQQMAELRYRFD